MQQLTERLDRTVIIRATPEVVFRFFTDTPRWAAWWGQGSTIDARVGGAVFIRHPGGTEVSGVIEELRPPERIVFTYGNVKGAPIPAGGSRVVIVLRPDHAGTRLDLTHEFADAAARDEHVQGWRFQLSLFANVVSDEVNANAVELVDAWFDAWAEPDVASRNRTLTRIAGSDVHFHDRYSNLDGQADLSAHITAAQRFMPGIRLHRDGGVRHCQGIVLADWVARNTEGKDLMRGTNVFVLGPRGQIESVTGVASRDRSSPAPDTDMG